MTLTFGSLFSGVGGVDLGFERAGLTCKWQCEIDENNRRILRRHWPSVTQWDDVHTFPPTSGDWSVDVIVGGDPCQENSALRQTDSTKHPSLGGEFIRIVDALRPRIVVRENPSRVRRDAPWPWFRFRARLELLGYAVLPFRLRSCCFGADHERDRLWLLAELQDSACERRPGAWQPGWDSEANRRRENNHVVYANRRPAMPRISRRDDGVSCRMVRRKAIGNAVDPIVAEWIARRLIEASNQ